MSDQFNLGTRVDLDGRTFFTKITSGGHRQVVERRVYAPGRPYECIYNHSIWHGGNGRLPTRMARRVLEAAGVTL